MPARKPKEEMPEDVRDQLELLKHPAPEVRRDAVQELGKLRHPAAVMPLTTALKDRYDLVRKAAAEALGNIGDKRAVVHLAYAIQKDRQVRVIEKAAQALVKIGDKSAVPYLIANLQTGGDNPSAKYQAAWALGTFKDKRAIPSLLEAFHNVELTWPASVSLGKIGHPSAIRPLLKELRDKRYKGSVLQSYAGQALGAIGRSLQGEEVKGKNAKALQFVAPYFQETEEPEVVLQAFQAALKGKITPENARLYVKQLRAMRGSLK